jgi:hypothetical protein
MRGEQCPAVYVNGVTLGYDHDGLIRLTYMEVIGADNVPVPRVAVIMTKEHARNFALMFQEQDQCAEDERMRTAGIVSHTRAAAATAAPDAQDPTTAPSLVVSGTAYTAHDMLSSLARWKFDIPPEWRLRFKVWVEPTQPVLAP